MNKKKTAHQSLFPSLQISNYNRISTLPNTTIPDTTYKKTRSILEGTDKPVIEITNKQKDDISDHNEYDNHKDNYPSRICRVEMKHQMNENEKIILELSDNSIINHNLKIFRKTDKISSYLVKKTNANAKLIRLHKYMEAMNKQSENKMKSRINNNGNREHDQCGIWNNNKFIKLHGRNDESKYNKNTMQCNIGDIKGDAFREGDFGDGGLSRSYCTNTKHSKWSKNENTQLWQAYNQKSITISKNVKRGDVFNTSVNTKITKKWLNAFRWKDDRNSESNVIGEKEDLKSGLGLGLDLHIKDKKIRDVITIQRKYRKHYHKLIKMCIHIQSCFRGHLWRQCKSNTSWQRTKWSIDDKIVMFIVKLRLWMLRRYTFPLILQMKALTKPIEKQKWVTEDKAEQTMIDSNRNYKSQYEKWLEGYNTMKAQLEEMTNKNTKIEYKIEKVEEIKIDDNNTHEFIFQSKKRTLLRSKLPIEDESNFGNEAENIESFPNQDCSCSEQINDTVTSQTPWRSVNRTKHKQEEIPLILTVSSVTNFSLFQTESKHKLSFIQEKQIAISPIFSIPSARSSIEYQWINNIQAKPVLNFIRNIEEIQNIKIEIVPIASLEYSMNMSDNHKNNYINPASSRSTLIRKFNKVWENNYAETGDNYIPSSRWNKSIVSIDNFLEKPWVVISEAEFEFIVSNKKSKINEKEVKEDNLHSCSHSSNDWIKHKLVKTLFPVKLNKCICKHIRKTNFHSIIQAWQTLRTKQFDITREGILKTRIHKKDKTTLKIFFNMFRRNAMIKAISENHKEDLRRGIKVDHTNSIVITSTIVQEDETRFDCVNMSKKFTNLSIEHHLKLSYLKRENNEIRHKNNTSSFTHRNFNSSFSKVLEIIPEISEFSTKQNSHRFVSSKWNKSTNEKWKNNASSTKTNHSQLRNVVQLLQNFAVRRVFVLLKHHHTLSSHRLNHKFVPKNTHLKIMSLGSFGDPNFTMDESSLHSLAKGFVYLLKNVYNKKHFNYWRQLLYPTYDLDFSHSSFEISKHVLNKSITPMSNTSWILPPPKPMSRNRNFQVRYIRNKNPSSRRKIASMENSFHSAKIQDSFTKNYKGMKIVHRICKSQQNSQYSDTAKSVEWNNNNNYNDENIVNEDKDLCLFIMFNKINSVYMKSLKRVFFMFWKEEREVEGIKRRRMVLLYWMLAMKAGDGGDFDKDNIRGRWQGVYDKWKFKIQVRRLKEW